MAGCLSHNEVVRQTPPSGKCRLPARPIGGFRGKASSAYSEVRVKHKLNICKTIGRPRPAPLKLKIRLLLEEFSDSVPVLLTLGNLHQMEHFALYPHFGRHEAHFFILDDVAELLREEA